MYDPFGGVWFDVDFPSARVNTEILVLCRAKAAWEEYFISLC